MATDFKQVQYEVIKTIEDTDLKKVYEQMVSNKLTENPVIFCNEALRLNQLESNYLSRT